MNWGHYVTIAFILFGAFIMYMVVQAFQMDFDLVAEDYYAQEIAYQEKINQKVNYKNLGSELSIRQTADGISVLFPKEIQPAEGEIYFYHPSRKIFDKKFLIALDGNGSQLIRREEIVAGRYHVNVTWKDRGKEYFYQQALFVK